MENKLPKFWELAENKIKYAGKRDKTINIKISINTARMMVEQEKAAPDLLEACRDASKFYQENFEIMPVGFQTIADILDSAIAKAVRQL